MKMQQIFSWIDEKYAAGAREIGVTCNPIQRKLFITADKERVIIDSPYSSKEVRIWRDILHEYIARLPRHY